MMTIGEVLFELRRAKPDNRVYFNFCDCVPTKVRSWRGVYSEPALGWEPAGYSGNVSEYPTVAKVITELETAISGIEYTGWKGGEYSYDERSPLHIDNSGDCTHTEIRRIEVSEYRVTLHTAIEER